MAKSPCAVFWDIQNIAIPKGQSAASIVSLVRSSIINLYNLKEIYFYCVCDVTKLPANVGNPLTNQDVNIIQAYDYTKDSADIKILDLMRKFVENQGKPGCAIILLSGDGDYAGTLNDLKKLHNITIFVISLATSFSIKLETVANYTFRLINGQLQNVKSFRFPKFFVSFSRFPISRGLYRIRMDLNRMTQPFGSIDRSAIDHDDEVIIGFPSLELARRAAARFNTARYHGTFLKAEILQNPPSEVLLKVQNSWPPPNRYPSVRASLKRSKGFRRSKPKCQPLPDSQSAIEKLKKTLSQDFIAMSISDRTIITDCTVSSSTSSNPSPSSTNKKQSQITKKTNGNGWPYNLYSQSTNIKCPTLIDLTQSPLAPLKGPRRPAKQTSSSSSTEPIVVDLTEEI